MNEMKNIPMDEYRRADGLSNHELQIFKESPASYIWNKTAPSDPNKVGTSDMGTALHAFLLEPNDYENQVDVANVKGRNTVAFQKQQLENPDKIILTESEYEQVRIMGFSASHHPVFKDLLEMDGDCEHSIFVDCPQTGLRLKIRPDKVCYPGIGLKPLYCDVKTTSNIDDWRSGKEWKNPLFEFGYGFTAAYYLYVGSIYHGVELTEYAFPIVQTSASLGRYPVDVFIITKDDLMEITYPDTKLTIWDDMVATLLHFKSCVDNNNFNQMSQFPRFEYLRKDEFIDDVEVTFEGDENE